MLTCTYAYTNTCDDGPVKPRVGMCRRHYVRMRRGQNVATPRRDPDWHKHIVIQEDGCWRWTGKISKTGGYGSFRDRCAHRVIFEIERGVTLSEDLELDHLCLFKLCVNPDHLEEVTREENLRRRWAIRTVCHNGHDLTLPDAYRPNGGFECYRCYKDTADRSNARAKARREAAKVGSHA